MQSGTTQRAPHTLEYGRSNQRQEEVGVVQPGIQPLAEPVGVSPSHHAQQRRHVALLKSAFGRGRKHIVDQRAFQVLGDGFANHLMARSRDVAHHQHQLVASPQRLAAHGTDRALDLRGFTTAQDAQQRTRRAMSAPPS
jgi:hypothetical protein